MPIFSILAEKPFPPPFRYEGDPGEENETIPLRGLVMIYNHTKLSPKAARVVLHGYSKFENQVHFGGQKCGFFQFSQEPKTR